MKKLMLLLFVLGLLMACGQKQEVTEEAPAVKDAATEAPMDSAAMDTSAAMDESAGEQE